MGPQDAGVEAQEPVDGLHGQIERVKRAGSGGIYRFQAGEEEAGAGQLAL